MNNIACFISSLKKLLTLFIKVDIGFGVMKRQWNYCDSNIDIIIPSTFKAITRRLVPYAGATRIF